MLNKIKYLRNKQGFTLIELIVVIVVLGILVLLAASSFLGQTEKARIAHITNDIKAYENAIAAERAQDDTFIGEWATVGSATLTDARSAELLYDKRGYVEDSVSFDNNYYLVDKDLIKTTLDGDFILSDGGDVYYIDEEVEGENIEIGFLEPIDQLSCEEAEAQGYICVTNADELSAMRDNLAGRYMIVNDIDLSSVANWEPIQGTSPEGYDESFTGTLDGNGYKINNLYAHHPGIHSVGLIGRNAGIIKNIWINNADVVGDYNVGTVVGYNQPEDGVENKISNIVAAGKVSGERGSVGGIVGYSYNYSGYTEIESIFSDVDVEGNSTTGGVIGWIAGANIDNVHSIGNVEGREYQIGGAVGYTSDNVNISNSSSSGDVSGYEQIGGLLGYLSGEGSIVNSHSSGNVTVEKSQAGGLVSYIYNDNAEIINSYTTGDVTSKSEDASHIGGLVGYMSGDVISSYATGNVNAKGSYVGGLIGYLTGGSIVDSYATGDVTSIGPNSRDVGGLVSQVNGLVESSYATGNVTSDGFQIGGLVSYLNNGSIINSHATGDVTAIGERASDVGGLTSRAYGDIYNSYSTGDVISSGDYAGGLTSWLSANIINSYSTGNVESDGDYIGGLAGVFASGSISNSYYAGEVSGTDGVGPVYGDNSSYDGVITNTYWDKDVFGPGDSELGEGKSTEEMSSQATFAGWDFDNIWKLDGPYPTLR